MQVIEPTSAQVDFEASIPRHLITVSPWAELLREQIAQFVAEEKEEQRRLEEKRQKKMEEAAAKKQVAAEQRLNMESQSESDEDMEMWKAFAQYENERMDEEEWS